MEWMAFIYLFLLSFTAIFIIVAIIVENNVSEDKPFKKWWRKHIIGIYPEDKDL